MSNSAQPSLRLTVETGPHAGIQYQCAAGEVRVGRGAGNDLCLPEDHTISDQHIRFYTQRGRWHVADAGSRNGTYVLGGSGLERLETPAVVAGESRVQLGATRIAVCLVPTVTHAPDVPPQPRDHVHLQIRHEAGKISYGFGGNAPIASLYSVDFTPDWVTGAVQRLEDAMRLANLGPDHAARALEFLRDLGGALARHLVPERVQEALARRGPGVLQITHDSELLAIPWEWVALADEAWCEHFDFGRQVALEQASLRLPERRETPRTTLLIAVNPTGDLEEAQAEGERLLRQLRYHEAWLDVVLLAGARVTVERLLGEMERADIVYYLGHGYYDPASPDWSGWQLRDGPLGVGQMRRLARPPRIVFSNACETAREAAQSKATHGYARNIGMASNLLLAGVEAYLGALWPIHAGAGAAFAAQFFEYFLDGAPIGAAVRRARRAAAASSGANDLAWASYILYGDPGLSARRPK